MFKYSTLLQFITTVLLFYSCEKQEILPDVCIDGDCQAKFILDHPQDANGYYHVKLKYNVNNVGRFTITVDANITDPLYWYTHSGPVISAWFDTTTTYDAPWGEVLPIVQSSSIYISKYSNTRGSSKRIVGPISKDFIGDTITITPTVYWDAGSKYQKRIYSLKFIVE